MRCYKFFFDYQRQRGKPPDSTKFSGYYNFPRIYIIILVLRIRIIMMASVGRYGVTFGFDTVDKVIENVKTVAVRRFKR